LTKLVIFDLDGVLLDSESLYKQLNFQLFDDLGVHITHEEYNSFIGIHAEHMWGCIKDKGDLSQSVQELIVMEREAKYNGLLESELIPNEGLYELLDLIKSEDIKLAIASSGLQKNVDVILTKLKVKDYFGKIVSGDMVENGKPAPDIFLLAASHFEIAPEHCLVIEDSRNGTLAAKAAGMTCFGYINEGSGPQDLSKADVIVEELSDERLSDQITGQV
jgi:HAD superfamily hydrolase (TIGR01509 family)